MAHSKSDNKPKTVGPTESNKKNNPLINQFKDRINHFNPEQILFETGDRLKGIYYIFEGVVKLQNTYGNEAVTFYLARPGDLLGINDLFQDHTVYSITATVLVPSKTGFLPSNKYFSLIQEHPNLGIEILGSINDQIDRIENRSKVMYGGDSQKKIKDLVAYMANTFGMDENQFLKVPLSPEDIADLSGTSKTYMRKLLPYFREQGLFESKKRHIRILNLEKVMG